MRATRKQLRTPELGEVLDRRIRPQALEEIHTVYVKVALTEPHTDIVMGVEEDPICMGVWRVNLASGKTSMVARTPEGKLIPVVLSAIISEE